MFIGQLRRSFRLEKSRAQGVAGTLVIAAAFLDVVWPVLVPSGSSAFESRRIHRDHPFDSCITLVTQPADDRCVGAALSAHLSRGEE